MFSERFPFELSPVYDTRCRPVEGDVSSHFLVEVQDIKIRQKQLYRNLQQQTHLRFRLVEKSTTGNNLLLSVVVRQLCLVYDKMYHHLTSECR